MVLIQSVTFYILIFLSVYVQVFFFVTFLENRKKIFTRNGEIKLNHYPTVTIVVPCFNEERTVCQTVRSLFNLNYPKNKVKIFLVNDGSTDGTWNIIKRFEKYSNIKIFNKENGGKYTALNLALKHTESDFFGGLDADSLADPESLVRIMSYFEKDPKVMAVAPSITVHNPQNIIQNVQKAEYHMGVYFKKMLGFLGAINVTPGPLTIFRKRVFDELGFYRHGHNAEDMEIAYRMQKNYYKIEHCNDAFVYTNTPITLRNLYRQRLRWIYGFINNTLDYKNVLFRKKYGNFSVFTLPVGLISIFSVSFLFSRIVYNVSDFLYSKILALKTIGLNFSSQAGGLVSSFDPFFFGTQSFLFLVVLVYALVFFAMIFGKKMTEGRWGFSLGMIYFFPLFSVIAPFWLLKAIYNTFLSKRPAWR